MAEPSLEMIMQLLPQMQQDGRETRENVCELVRRVSGVEHQLAHVGVEMANLNARIDRLSDRVERIERRLELVAT